MSQQPTKQVIVIGGGAAGFFGAITCGQALRGSGEVLLLERGAHFLQKVKISGGGRCNVTHSCFDPRALSARYPRGARALIGAFTRFQPTDTIRWFEERGVALKTEADGRMFPTTDTSQTIIDCLMRAAQDAGVKVRTHCGVDRIARRDGGGFMVTVGRASLPGQTVLTDAGAPGGAMNRTTDLPGRDARPTETIQCDKVLLATGGCRASAAGGLAESLGHTIEPPVPSLFTLHIDDARLQGISGLAVEAARASVPGTQLSERGPVLVTHWGLSGPAILRLSAWGARELAALNYVFPVRINWLGDVNSVQAAEQLQVLRQNNGAKLIRNVAMPPVPMRLWEKIVAGAQISSEARWSGLTKQQSQALTRELTEAEFKVTGKSMNKEEFVTCGGVKLPEVNFKTMESRVCPGLYFAGELLDVDGITGGFNFQAAWTTGWLAGNAMAEGLA